MTTAKQVNQALRTTRSRKHDDKRESVQRKFDNEKLNALFDQLRRIGEERRGKAEVSND